MDTSTMWLILKLSSMDSEEFGYVTYKFFGYYIGSDMTQACLKLQGVHVANAAGVRILLVDQVVSYCLNKDC